MKNLLISSFGKALSKSFRLFNLGNGTTWPGHLALKANPHFLKEVLKDSPIKIICIAGTNGKTTTATLIKNALERKRLCDENLYLKKQLGAQYSFENITGKSSKLIEVFDTIRKIADSPATVMITGESGTGKELVARAIHFNSNRRDKPFVSVNCGAIPEGLMESELFGHVKGSFTGATANKTGLFSAADGLD